MFIGSSTINVSKYSENRRGIYFSLPKINRITTWPTKIFTLHWINCIIPNNKCIFTQLNAVFTICMNKHILLVNSVTKHQIDSVNFQSYVPRLYHRTLERYTINNLMCVKFCALKTFEVTEQHQVFVRRC
jgi:hypothetical protein